MVPAVVSCAAGLGFLFVSGHFIVRGAKGVATAYGIDEFVIGATVVAMGTSVPELATSLGTAGSGARAQQIEACDEADSEAALWPPQEDARSTTKRCAALAPRGLDGRRAAPSRDKADDEGNAETAWRPSQAGPRSPTQSQAGAARRVDGVPPL